MLVRGRASLRGISMCQGPEAEDSLEYLTVTVIQFKHRQMVKKKNKKDGRDSYMGKTTYLSNTIVLISKVRFWDQGDG